MQKKRTWWERLLFSEFLAKKSASQRIAYIAVMTAFCVVGNMFFSFPLGDLQVSLTTLISALSGILIGPIFGFTASLLGDFIGVVYAGYVYMPWIGIATGLTAFVPGILFSFIKGNGRVWFVYVKLAVVCVLTFLICTVAINTTAFWGIYAPKTPYFTYFVTRMFVQGQIWVSLINYVLLFILVPSLNQILPLEISGN